MSTHPSPVAEVVHADSIEHLRTLPDDSIDAIITDPPYGLSATSPRQVLDAITQWSTGDRGYIPSGQGFMGSAWDAFVPPPALWDECLRVLKPGGHLAAFAGARTHDLMTMSIRLAGFEIRDSLVWLSGSGMPHGADVGRMVEAEVRRTAQCSGENEAEHPAVAQGRRWTGWNSAVNYPPLKGRACGSRPGWLSGAGLLEAG